MIKRLLVANRGEIAVRIMATSSAGWTATVSMPSTDAVAMMRTAISPRLATSSRLIIG